MARESPARLTPAQLARRLEIGEDRRARTRARLMDAAYRLFALRGADAPTIDDVVEQAGVARGTFYNHFETRDVLFRAVADEISVSIGSLITPRLAGIEDPAMRVALAFRIFVHHAVSDQARGWILLRTMPLFGPLNETIKTAVDGEFANGLNAGRFRGVSTPILVDLGIGLELMTINRLLVGGCGEGHIDQAAQALLVALGIDEGEARAIATAPIDFEAFPPIA